MSNIWSKVALSNIIFFCKSKCTFFAGGVGSESEFLDEPTIKPPFMYNFDGLFGPGEQVHFFYLMSWCHKFGN